MNSILAVIFPDVREPSSMEDLLLSLDAMQADWALSLHQHWQLALVGLARDTQAAGRLVRTVCVGVGSLLGAECFRFWLDIVDNSECSFESVCSHFMICFFCLTQAVCTRSTTTRHVTLPVRFRRLLALRSLHRLCADLTGAASGFGANLRADVPSAA